MHTREPRRHLFLGAVTEIKVEFGPGGPAPRGRSLGSGVSALPLWLSDIRCLIFASSLGEYIKL